MTPEDLKKQDRDRAEYTDIFNRATQSDSEETDEAIEEYAEFRSVLGDKINTLFAEAESDRREIEQRWLKDLRQYRGEYDPDTKIKMHPNRAKTYMSITRTKTKTVSARQTDLLFPANGEKNWGLEPTPIPELNPQIIKSIMEQYKEATGEEPPPELIKKFINDEAVNRSEAMEKEIEDQLSELKYRSIMRAVIHSGNQYGTGILKGPLVKESIVKRWLPNEQTGEWVMVEIPKLSPYCEFVPCWDCYPDMTARKPEDMRYIFQRHVMNRNQVLSLANRSDFNGEVIRTYLRVNDKGDAEVKNHENDLKALNPTGSENDTFKETTVAGTANIGTGTGVLSRKGKYEVKEFWGYLSTNELMEIGVDIDPDALDLEVAANIWMLGPLVVKAVVSGIEGVDFPFHFYYYDKDDSSIWGDGIPSIMRDAQKAFNAAIRAMLDNAAISAGPIVEVNTDLIDGSEDPREIYPFKVYLRDGVGMEAQADAVRVTTLPSYTNEFITMINFFMTAADEVTAIPRYMYGDTSKVGGAGQTATGLSMLMGAANVTLKELVKNFDDGVTKPFIRAMYFWNMDFNPKEHIKGDYNVVPKGSTSLIAREVKTEAIEQFMAITNNEMDMMYVNRDTVLREWAKINDIDDRGFIKDRNTVALESESRSKEMAEDKAFEKELAMIKAKSGGHMTTPGMQPNMENLSQEQMQGGQIPEVAI